MSTLTTTSHLSRRSRAAVSEECYASSRTPLRLIGDPTYPIYRSSERTRTSKGSSDDQDPVQGDGFINEAFRAGGPQLCTVPVATELLSPDHPSYHFVTDNLDRLAATVLPLLTNGGVRGVKEMFFCMRQSVFDKEPEPIITLFVEAEKTAFDSTWLNVIREIHSFFCRQNIPQCSIEIADNRAFDMDKIFPLDPSDRIFAQWYEVVDSIWTHCHLEDVNTIGCFRIGRSDDWRENPPTVFITVNPNTDLDWKMMREDVILILENHYLSMVAVKIQRDRIIRGFANTRSPDMPLDVLLEPALAGQSLGRRGLNDKQGTFGGHIQLQHPHSHEWFTFGISCTHCVLPDDDQVDTSQVQGIQNWRMFGVSTNDEKAQQTLKLDHPSLKDLGEAIGSYESQISWLVNEDYIKVQAALNAEEYVMDPDKERFLRTKSLVDQCEKGISRIEQFRASNGHYLGSVFAASDLRVLEPEPYPECNMDWALIKLPASRIGDNRIMTPGPANRLFPIELRDQVVTPLVPKQPLFKSGRATGYTTGYYAGVKTAHVEHHLVNGAMVPMRTWEHAITNHFEGSFSRRGDFGSLVFDIGHNVVGLLYAGAERSNVSYFTHIKDLFKSIEKVTKATGVRIME